MLNYAYQIVDPVLLKTRLFESVLYLHSQPPLFNTFLGCVLKLFPNHFAFAFNVIYFCLGLVLAVSLLELMFRLGVSTTVATILTVLFIIGPSCILYENWLFYTYPLTAGLCVSGLLLHTSVTSGRTRHAIMFFAILAILVLTRSLFHFLWFVLIALTWFIGDRQRRRTILLACLVPFLAVFVLYAKNLYLFGTFTSSSWFGMNLARMTTSFLPDEERALLVEKGTLSRLALLLPFRDCSQYRSYVSEMKKTNVLVLDQEVKSTGGTNFNNSLYVEVSRLYGNDAARVMIIRPQAYLMALFRAYYIYVLPANLNKFLDANDEKIWDLDRAYDLLLCRVLHDGIDDVIRAEINGHYATLFLNLPILLLLGLPYLWFYGLRRIIKGRAGAASHRTTIVTLLYIWLNITYVTVVGNCLEVGENNRFRFMLDPFYLAILGFLITDAIRVVKQRVQSSSGRSTLFPS
jgi:hypothetical protein